MHKYGVGDCTSLLEDLVKEKMADKGKKRKKAQYVLREYGMEDRTELLEELDKESEPEESEGEFIVAAGALRTAEKELSVEGSGVVRKVGAKCKKEECVL